MTPRNLTKQLSKQWYYLLVMGSLREEQVNGVYIESRISLAMLSLKLTVRHPRVS